MDPLPGAVHSTSSIRSFQLPQEKTTEIAVFGYLEQIADGKMAEVRLLFMPYYDSMADRYVKLSLDYGVVREPSLTLMKIEASWTLKSSTEEYNNFALNPTNNASYTIGHGMHSDLWLESTIKSSDVDSHITEGLLTVTLWTRYSLQRAPSWTAISNIAVREIYLDSLLQHLRERKREEDVGKVSHHGTGNGYIRLTCKGKSYITNEIILTSQSEIFNKCLSTKHNWHERTTRTICIEDSTTTAVQAMITYLETAQKPIAIQDDCVVDVLKLACRYMIHPLIRAMEERLYGSLDVENAGEIWLLAESLALSTAFKALVQDFIKENIVRVIPTEGWSKIQNLHPALVNVIMLKLAAGSSCA